MRTSLGHALAGFLGVLEAGCSVFGIRTVEEARYKVIAKEGRFEIREYAEAVVAETTVDATYAGAGNTAFRRMFGYISGGNTSRARIAMTAPVIQEPTSEKIPMTAPVTQEKSDKGWRMAFVLPAGYTLETAPQPLSPDVVLRKMAARRVAVIRYSGWLSEASMQASAGKLTDWIEQEKYRTASPPRLAAYDPPWTLPFLRRNEVHIDVE